MPNPYRPPLHLWLASPCCFVLGLLALVHGVILNGLCVFLFGFGGLIVIFRRNAPEAGPPEKIALACFGFGGLLLIAIFVRDLSAGRP
jgi:hypothetical protein